MKLFYSLRRAGRKLLEFSLTYLTIKLYAFRAMLLRNQLRFSKIFYLALLFQGIMCLICLWVPVLYFLLRTK